MPRRWHCRPGGLGGAGSAQEKVALQAWRTRGGGRQCPGEGGTAGLEDSWGQAVPTRWHCGLLGSLE